MFCYPLWLYLNVIFCSTLSGISFSEYSVLGICLNYGYSFFCIAAKKPNRKGDDINFDDDDDDLLLGLDSPGSKRKKDLKSSDEKGDGGRPGSAKSVLDDLLGRNVDSRLQPSSGDQKLSFDSLTYSK